MFLSLCYIVFHVNDLIDIILVAALLYGLYNLLKGTTAINIFLGIVAIIILWRVVVFFNMKMLSAILNSFISVGFIALIVVFQPEIRTFLLVLGKPISESNRKRKRFLFGKLSETKREYDYNTLLQVAYRFAESRTGAIILLTRKNKLDEISKTGEIINAEMSDRLLGNLFFKNSPLHDGAVIISRDKIIAAGCILPVSNNQDLPLEYGLRHRAAIGVTEQTDAVAIVVSEERGTVSVAIEGKIHNAVARDKFIGLINSCFPMAIDFVDKSFQ